MVNRLGVVVCFFLFIQLNAQSKKDIRLYKIKELTENTVLYENGKQVASYKSEITKFDKEGNTIENITYNSDGTIRRKEAAKYSGKNKIEELVQVVNNTKKADEENTNEKYKHTTSKYNSNNDKTEEVWYDEKGSIIKKETIAYNSRGDRLFEITYDGSGKIIQKIAYGYDAKGLRTEKKVFDSNDALIKHVRYTYIS